MLAEHYCGVMEAFTAAAHLYEQYMFLFPADFLLLSASYILHCAAFQTPQGVTWSGGQLIYVD